MYFCFKPFVQRRNKGSRNCTATTKENIDDSNRNSCTSIPVAAVYSKINALISDENADDSEYRCYLFELPESVLFVLLSYLDVSSIYRLSQTCSSFREYLRQPRMWRKVDVRNEPIASSKTLLQCCVPMHDWTTDFRFRSKNSEMTIVSDRFFRKMISLQNLKVIALENQYICGEKYDIRIFPPSMEELSLRSTLVRHTNTFLRFLWTQPRLRVLILDHCKWVGLNEIVLISRLSTLEVLSLYMCLTCWPVYHGNILRFLKNCDLPRLKVFNARLTGCNNDILTTFCRSVQEIYFQCYSSTYQFDRFKRKREISQGAKREDYSYISEHEEGNYAAIKIFLVGPYGDANFLTQETDVISDQAISDLKFQEVPDGGAKPVTSVLFKGPYPECTCDFRNKFQQSQSTGSISDDKVNVDGGTSTENDTYKTEDDNKPRSSNLRRVSLRGYSNVTDVSLEHLNDMRLELLDVFRTGVTETGVAKFLRNNPNCRVIHETACTCSPRMHF